ncbi:MULTISPECIES: hypothetical protein [unclassified Yoonia]|uniref:hypothetical protein n=1 Tax=unclassified Yoonia TaxID=2629118 RepID=UPI002B00046A|nr:MULTISPECIES: hypothetical protein [unclassified Yoonia]
MKDEINFAAESVAAQINDLNAGWRNQVASAMGMDPKTFQLAQGTLGLQTTDSSGLFLMADAVPPQSTTAFFDPSGKNHRSTAYNQLLHAMLPTSTSGLRAALGDQYANWIVYRNADTSDLSQEELFKKWANRRLDPDQTNAAITAFNMTLSDPINVALTNYVDPANLMTFTNSAGQSFTLPIYSSTIDVAKNAIATSAQSAKIDYNSATADTNSTGTTVSGSASGFYDIFSGGVDGSFTELNQMAASSNFTITGTINKYATIASDAGAWYDGSLVSRAYNAKGDYAIWDPKSNMGDWDSFFGSNGSLARRVSQLLLVSDYSLTVTSAARYSVSEFQQIKSSAKFGIWPFFSASADATHTKSMTHNEDGSLSVTYTLAPGLIAIWGATVQSAPN